MDELEQAESVNNDKPERSSGSMRTTAVDEVAANPAFLVPTDGDPLIGQLFAQKYRVLARLGHGGMSVVYKANDVLLNRLVALKILLPNLVWDVNGILRFRQEARAASHLNNPHIIKIYEFTVPAEGQPYLVMDYVGGMTLADVIKEEGRLDPKRCLEIFMQACDGLMHAHDNSVIHRDLKPSNVMITKTSFGEDFVHIVDFGIAKLMLDDGDMQLHLTQTGEVFGSPYYMSPEQCRGEKLDARSDIYSMGCLMYEAIAGQVPLRAGNAMQTIMKHVNEQPEQLSIACGDHQVPPELNDAVMKTLAKNPDNRHQSMHELYADLKSIRDGLNSPPAVASPSVAPAVALGAGPAVAAQTATVPPSPEDSQPTPAAAAMGIDRKYITLGVTTTLLAVLLIGIAAVLKNSYVSSSPPAAAKTTTTLPAKLSPSAKVAPSPGADHIERIQDSQSNGDSTTNTISTAKAAALKSPSATAEKHTTKKRSAQAHRYQNEPDAADEIATQLRRAHVRGRNHSDVINKLFSGFRRLKSRL